MRTVRSSIRQAFFSGEFLIGLIGVTAVVFLSRFSDLMEAFRLGKGLPNAFHQSFIADAAVSDAMNLALPVLAALPFTASLVNDLNSGFIRYYLHRTDRKSYLAGRCAACGLSGGAVLVLGIAVSYLISAAVFIPMEDPAAKEAAEGTFYADLMKRMVLVFLSGAFWSLCGLALSAVTRSRYMAYASPFILCYVLVILHERYFDKVHVLYPKEWIDPSPAWMLGEGGVVLLLSGLIAAAGTVFCFAAGRRLSQL